MMKPENLQDRFLNRFQLRGTILSFDQFAVLVNSEGRQNLIYKHAISTIQPAEPVKVMSN